MIGLGHALDLLSQFKKSDIRYFLDDLHQYTKDKILTINDLEVIGNATEKVAIFSFIYKNNHPHDIAQFLGNAHIAVRAGNLCTQPIMDFFQIEGTTRVSFSIYNTKDDIDLFVNKIKQLHA